MAQNELLKLIQESPGIKQSILKKQVDICEYSVSAELERLRRSGQITRIPTEDRRSFHIYPVVKA